MENSVPLLHRVDSALRQSPHLAGHNVILETVDGEVTMRGTVDSFFKKQMAQEAVRNIAGIDRILNQLEVAPARTAGTLQFS